MDELTEGGELLARLHHKGIRVWVENGDLHCKGPRGALSKGDREDLAHSKLDVVRLLSRPDISTELRSLLHRAPLSFSQAAHWKRHDMDSGRGNRTIAGAFRVRG